ncbi:xanthine dehydrogenase family protein molybdopterin-binding subunit [Thermanaerothrix sp.]|jgi:CO/xanthine dehydrogenase Mo-binding subunit|uniref:xanthine dehydrogenase family protein molybdopterin-binding subunit n=1 Tax=Thermanaerothrix sp. TaxID=2972675 RepID=UPI002ADE1DDB|nr:xanthine dehydrogenase family protein molybdopterin-binding subunit [Thermanaerothrix sp.]
MEKADYNVIGKPIPRIDAISKVTGNAKYPGDLSMPGMLHMKIRFAERPHARILDIDTSKAEAYPGVVAVFTAKDVPVNEYGLQQPDQPVLCGPGSDKPGADIVRFVGDQVALVVAETEEAAAAACSLIEITYEDLPVVTDPREAMKPDAPLIHPERGDTNICVHYKIRKGDVEEGFAQADVIVESEYQLPFQEHAYLQPEAGLAYVDDEGRITVQVAGQWTHTDQKQIAHALNLPLDKVRVIYPAIGGAFGGREDMSVQIVLALAAWKLNRPVKIIWSRRESIIGHGKRHPMYVRARWGATREGKLVAAETEIIADAGAYLYTTNKVLGNATVVHTGPYFIPHVKADVYGVYTNNLPTCAFRGFGAPQALFVAEMQMNKLAEMLDMDPVEFRLKNALREGQTLAVGTTPPDPISISEVIRTASERFGWEQRKRELAQQDPQATLKRGIGFACGFKNVGFSFGYQENCWARIELHGAEEIERVVLHHAGAEVGQGTHTVMVQMAAEALGVPVEKITLVTHDTLNLGNAGSVSASRMTFMAGNAIRGAAEIALRKWRDEERPAIGEYTYLAPKTTPFTPETGYSMPNFAYAYVAQAVEVEVDTETGQVRVIRVVSADDVGQAINPQLVEGQIEGAVVQAQGYALLENFIMKDGYVLTDQLSTYLIPTVLDVPEKVEPVIVHVPDPRGPWGARGVGELPYLPLTPAVLAAIHDATGIWMNAFPVTPERLWKALQTTQPAQD